MATILGKFRDILQRDARNQTKSDNIIFEGADATVVEEALENLAAVIMSDKLAVTAITITNTHLINELEQAKNQVDTLTKDTLSLKVKIAYLEGTKQGRSDHNQGGHGGHGGQGCIGHQNIPRMTCQYKNKNYF